MVHLEMLPSISLTAKMERQKREREALDVELSVVQVMCALLWVGQGTIAELTELHHINLAAC